MNEHFYAPLELKFSSSQNEVGRFSGYGSVASVIDSGGDMILPGAFKASLERMKSEGRMPSMYAQHGAALGADPRPIGVWTNVTEDEKGLHVEGKLIGLDTETGKYNYALMKEGAMTGLSIGYRVKKADYGKKPGEPRRTIKEAELFEVSVVDQPMNTHARVAALKSIEDLFTLSEAEDYLKSLGMSGTQAVAFISRIKRFGSGNPNESADGHGPGDPGDDDIKQILDAVRRRGNALR
jgi:HK97 family phage prohead protease